MTILTRTARGALALTALIALAACEHGDPVSQGGGPLGRATLVSSSPSSATLPSGTATSFTHFGGFLEGVPDAFSRQPTDARHGQYYSTASAFWRFRQAAGRNANAGSLDPRYPLLGASDAVMDFPIDIYTPAAEGCTDASCDHWEMWVQEIGGLAPGAQYTLVMVKYALKVRGQLDQEEMILTGAVTEPDSLYIAEGTRGEIPLGADQSNWTSDAPAGCGTFPGANTNPFVIAQEESDPDGFFYPDKCWTPGGALYGSADDDTQRTSMVGRQDDEPFTLPNYNYIELWEGDYGTGTPVLRVQIAQDQDPIGKTINNTYAPFPAPQQVDVTSTLVDSSAFPISDDVKARLTGAIGVPDSVSVTATNVARLDQGVYKVWYLNPTTGAAKPAVGKYTRTLDGVVQADSAVGTSTFQGGQGTITFTSGPYLADAGTPEGTYDDSLRFVVITKEADAAAATPSGSQPLWQNIFKIPPGTAGGSLFFGDFNSGTSRFRFIPQGSLSGAVIGDTVPVMVTDTVDNQVVQVRQLEFQGSVLDVTMTGLTRPPEGYRYQAYLFTARDANTTPVTDSALVNIGGLKDRAGESLDDADVAAASANISATRIEFAQLLYDVAREEPAGDVICQYDRLRVYLEPKGRAVGDAPPTLIFNLALPGRVTTASRCQQ